MSFLDSRRAIPAQTDGHTTHQLFSSAPDRTRDVGRRLIEGADQLIRMPIESGLKLFTGLPAIVGILPTLRRNWCPRWGRITHTGGN
jgi:hypothetical protein